ncbi:hypothetical protein MSAN_00972700 [Mycena sanguinolenta]|uniref:Uncharacterized protein n=1 Tax=Mycena sanguinolenta TaxID=230812 RepID=A0A8H6Z0H6_9AGAR|nr:hypothetical protein MSAN_00972700 [Mycena sanguinolenta]
MLLLSRFRPRLGNVLSTSRRAPRGEIATCNSSSGLSPDLANPQPAVPPDTSERRRSAAVQPIGVDLSMGTLGPLDGRVLVDNNNERVSGLPLDRTQSINRQTPHGGLSIHGNGHTFDTVSWVAGDNIINTVYNNFYYPEAGRTRNSHPNLEGLRPQIKNHRHLLRIVGVAIAFRGPPSVLQISEVLGLPEEEVCQSIRAVTNYLRTPVEIGGKIRLPEAFSSDMYRSCLPTIGAAHGCIARWCLQGAMKLPRHIDYALAFWAWHVCQATPSVELTAALESFPFALCTITEHQLLNVIQWLERFDGLFGAAHLVSQYQARLANLAEMQHGEG